MCHRVYSIRIVVGFARTAGESEFASYKGDTTSKIVSCMEIYITFGHFSEMAQ